MTKLITSIGSCKNGCIGLHKHACKIPKVVIHAQASFNNTFVIVTNVQRWVISLSFASTCGFKGMDFCDYFLIGVIEYQKLIAQNMIFFRTG